MYVIINPGTGPVDGEEGEAWNNMAQFVQDLEERGIEVEGYNKPEADSDDGRFLFNVILKEGITREVEMPGVPLENVRWLDREDQNIWDFPRLYVDGSSWVWKFALNVFPPERD